MMEKEHSHIDPIALLPRLLAGEATPAEEQTVANWRNSSPANQTRFDEFARIWEITGQASVSDEIDINREWQRMESVLFASRVPTFHIGWIRYAAAVFVFVAAGGLIYSLLSGQSFRAPRHSTRTISLTDGSRATLNAGSVLREARGFGLTNRNLQLKGEAFFEVQPDSARPFLVDAGPLVVQVTGTRFNLNARPEAEKMQVVVARGSVWVSLKKQPQRKETVGAGQEALFDPATGNLSVSFSQNQNALAWKTRLIDFRNTPLHEAVKLLSDVYHVHIDTDDKVTNCMVTVRFDNQPLNQVLEVLASTLDLTVTKQKNYFLLSGKGCLP